jgi:hypothetical protein
MKIKPCEICGLPFNNIFEMVDHLREDPEPPFDPVLLLPNGYKLLVGTLLRLIHEQSNKPSQVRKITEGAYTTLYLAENDEHAMRESIEDVMVEKFMSDLDAELRELLEDNGNAKEND